MKQQSMIAAEVFLLSRQKSNCEWLFNYVISILYIDPP